MKPTWIFDSFNFKACFGCLRFIPSRRLSTCFPHPPPPPLQFFKHLHNSVPKRKKQTPNHFPFIELSTSCRLLQNRNPKDPWTDQSPIPLPDQTKLHKFVHYDQDTRAGCESWHEPVDVPFSGEALNFRICMYSGVLEGME